MLKHILTEFTQSLNQIYTRIHPTFLLADKNLNILIKYHCNILNLKGLKDTTLQKLK